MGVEGAGDYHGAMRPSDERPLLALTLGDPAGIGPEIVHAALGRPEWAEAARWVAIGPASLCPEGLPPWDAAEPAERSYLAVPAAGDWQVGRATAAGGRAALAALAAGADLAQRGQVEGLVTAPVSKEALHLAGEPVEGQTELLARWAGVERYEMLAVAGSLRVLLLTRHMPLRRALESITVEGVLDHLRLLDATLRQLGLPRPRLALAGLNPHAGEGGLLGGEEQELLEPALRRARGEGLLVEGPVSPDSVFLQALAGRHDGVLALYHDQAFIPLKLVSQDRGLTLIAGLPYLRVSPVHGTAFDIAGQGRASAENLVQAGLQAAAWARARRG